MNRSFTLIAFLLLLLVGCNKTDLSVDKSDYASVSIYSVIPNAPDFNLFLNGNNVAVHVPFGSYTLYNKIPAGNVTMRAQSTLQNLETETTFAVTARKYYSLFLTGDSSKINTIALHDSLPSSALDSFGVRFFVFSPGVSGWNFHLVKSSDTSAANKNRGWSNRSYSDSITSDTINTFKKFAAGTYSLYALSKTNKDTLARFTNRTFSDSSNYTLMLEGHLKTRDTTLMLGNRLHQ